MKKALSILLAAIMLLLSQSITFGTHFCGGKAVLHQLMAGVSALGCGMPGMDTACKDVAKNGRAYLSTESCCQDQFLLLELNEVFKPAIHTRFDSGLSVLVPATLSPMDSPSPVLLSRQLMCNAPPSRGQPPLHIRYQTFLI